jgi:Tol biopolymer transport system component/C-terminal processing protease CtpA/Prc
MRTIALLAVGTLAGVCFAQDPIIGARNLALSPDGKELAFSYQGDIWVASSAGGRAFPVTSHVEMDDNPVWSPDGKWIAFSSTRTGGNDIFVVKPEGGKPKRVTFWSGNDTPTDWTPDGKAIVFRGYRDDNWFSVYSVNVESGALKRHAQDIRNVVNPVLSPDGKFLAYQRSGFPAVRPRYEGSAAAQLVSVDLATGKRQSLRDNRFQHLWSKWSPDGKAMFTVSVAEKTPSTRKVDEPFKPWTDNSRRTPNIHKIGLDGKSSQITDYVGGAGVRFLTVARNASVMAYERDGKTFTQDLKPGTAKEVKIFLNSDDKTPQEQRQILSGNADGFALSPNGEMAILEARSELWMVPIKKGKGPNADDATQLTNWAGIDTDPIWGQDNKTVYFRSDRNGAVNLFQMDSSTATAVPITKDATDITSVQLMPSKKAISFVRTGVDAGLWKYDLTTKQITKVISRTKTTVFADDTDYTWSPDERYVAFSDEITRSGYYFWENAVNVNVFDTMNSKTVNVSRINAREMFSQWSSDGKYLYFMSNRQGDGIYALPLSNEAARPQELELKYEKPKEPVKLNFDFEDVSRRVRRLLPDGFGYAQMDPETGALYYLRGGDIWRAEYSGEEARAISGGGGIGSFAFSSDNSKLIALKGGVPTIINIRTPNFASQSVTFRADWTRDLKVEREAAYRQFWRSYNRSFYDPHFHGRNWEDIGKRYFPFLGSVGHPSEMAFILGCMTGELEASHAEVSAPGSSVRGSTSAVLGLEYDYEFAGPGLKIATVPRRTPGSYAKTKLNPGEVITKINGKEVSLNENLFAGVLADQVGREVNLTVKGTDGKERSVKFRAISSPEYMAISDQNIVDRNRDFVDKQSGGQLGYVYIAGMGGGNLVDFNLQFWEAVQDKKGMIIDVRGNGGGNISDRIIDMVERKPHSYYQSRGGEAFIAPGQAFDIPIIVMCDDTSMSNAEMFPYAMRQRGIAKLLGVQTPGYVIWTGGLPLVDGTSARMPGGGVFRMDGTPLENLGVKPDFELKLDTDAHLAGKDSQLERAIEILKK